MISFYIHQGVKYSVLIKSMEGVRGSILKSYNML